MGNIDRTLRMVLLLAVTPALGLVACATPESLCEANLEQYQTCSDAFTEPDDETSFIDGCLSWFDASGNEQRCYDALVALAECMNGLSCGEWGVYWDGDPTGGDSYPCKDEDIDFYMDEVCVSFLE